MAVGVVAVFVVVVVVTVVVVFGNQFLVHFCQGNGNLRLGMRSDIFALSVVLADVAVKIVVEFLTSIHYSFFCRHSYI